MDGTIPDERSGFGFFFNVVLKSENPLSPGHWLRNVFFKENFLSAHILHNILITGRSS
jgi:hypothetical protein